MLALRPRFRPVLESLEGRACPAAPIVSLSAVVTGSTVTLSGFVHDETPAGLNVSFMGKYAGSVTTDSNGFFSVSVENVAPGLIMAYTTDPGGATSNLAMTTVPAPANLAPIIVNFTATPLGGRVWLFAGQVQDESAAGLTVSFGGLPSMENVTVLVQADGTFSYQCELPIGETGTITASVIDWWGLESNTAWDIVSY